MGGGHGLGREGEPRTQDPGTRSGPSLPSRGQLEGPWRAGKLSVGGHFQGLGLGTGQARGQSAESTSSLLCARSQPPIALLLKGEGVVSSEAVTWDLLETQTPRPSPHLLLQKQRVSGANPRSGANARPCVPWAL